MSDTEAETPDEQIKVAFDISDLVQAYRRRHTPSGIQRVQQELCLELLERTDPHVEIVAYDRLRQDWRMLSRDWILNLFETARRFEGGEQDWRSAFQPFASQFSAFLLKPFRRGGWLVNAGTSWAFPGYFIQLRQLRRAGVRFAVFLHDCIPERHPEFFEPALVAHHSYWLAQIRECADLVICNSEATRRDYLELVRPTEAQAVHVLPLNGAWREGAGGSDEVAAANILSRAGIRNDDFVLTVGTIEPRKNHLTMLRVWDALRQARGDNSPKLLCVGRIGWKSDNVLEEARARGLFDSTVLFVSDVSDEALRALYSRCLFTLYISAYEGWGLPVSESLSAGKLCIAGDHPALKEAGDGFAIHVNPRSESEVLQAVSRLLDDPQRQLSAEQRIRENYRPARWQDKADALCAMLRTEQVSESVLTLPELRPSLVYRFGREEALRDFANSDMAEMFCTGRGWHQWEGWGTWTRRETAELAFRLRGREQLPPLMLGLRAPPGGAAADIALNGKPLLQLSHFDGDQDVRLELPRTHFAPTEQEMRIVRLKISASRVQNLQHLPGSKDQRVVGLGYRFIKADPRNTGVDAAT